MTRCEPNDVYLRRLIDKMEKIHNEIDSVIMLSKEEQMKRKDRKKDKLHWKDSEKDDENVKNFDNNFIKTDKKDKYEKKKNDEKKKEKSNDKKKETNDDKKKEKNDDKKNPILKPTNPGLLPFPLPFSVINVKKTVEKPYSGDIFSMMKLDMFMRKIANTLLNDYESSSSEQSDSQSKNKNRKEPEDKVSQQSKDKQKNKKEKKVKSYQMNNDDQKNENSLIKDDFKEMRNNFKEPKNNFAKKSKNGNYFDRKNDKKEPKKNFNDDEKPDFEKMKGNIMKTQSQINDLNEGLEPPNKTLKPKKPKTKSLSYGIRTSNELSQSNDISDFNNNNAVSSNNDFKKDLNIKKGLSPVLVLPGSPSSPIKTSEDSANVQGIFDFLKKSPINDQFKKAEPEMNDENTGKLLSNNFEMLNSLKPLTSDIQSNDENQDGNDQNADNNNLSVTFDRTRSIEITHEHDENQDGAPVEKAETKPSLNVVTAPNISPTFNFIVGTGDDQNNGPEDELPLEENVSGQ
ncbi:hypothetical protein DMUE_4354 [Dictyocoela muelleri]|nr:hypothetical protein DMUE_4354 [Dictyocoela muelleri]